MKSYRSSTAFMIVLLVAMITPRSLYAQESADTSRVWHIETSDKNHYHGQIIYQDNEIVAIRTEAVDSLPIRRQFIRVMEVSRPQTEFSGTDWNPNLQSARYLWAPNGYGLHEGEGYYQNIWVVFNQVSYGLTDNFSLGIGTIPVFLWGAGVFPVWVTPKFSIPVVRDKINVGVGVLAFTVIGEEDATAGILYGTTTFGSRDKNLTLGIGQGWSPDGFARIPTFTLSGMVRVSPRTYLLTENYLISASEENLGLLMFGGRSFIQRVSIDYGLLVPVFPGIDTFIAIPWLGLTVPFGNTNYD